MEILFKTGSIMGTGAEVIVNSANGALLHGGGTAASISIASDSLPELEKEQFNEVVSEMPGVAGVAYRKAWKPDGRGRIMATRLQLASANLLAERGGVPFSQGDVVVMDGKDIGLPQRIIHCVAMTYDFAAPDDPQTGRSPLIPATRDIVKRVVGKALDAAYEGNLGKTIAFTVMCARNGGLTPAQSLAAVLDGIHSSPRAAAFEKIFVVGDNDATADIISSRLSLSSLSVLADSLSSA